ncbi:hypothetical protein CDEF62S_04812 [Castellaniella defragrans]
MVTVPVPSSLTVAPVPVATLTVPPVTVSVVVSRSPSTSATLTPCTASGVSSAVVNGVVLVSGTVFTGASFAPLIVTVTVLAAVPSADFTVKVSVIVWPAASDCTWLRLLSTWYSQVPSVFTVSVPSALLAPRLLLAKATVLVLKVL